MRKEKKKVIGNTMTFKDKRVKVGLKPKTMPNKVRIAKHACEVMSIEVHI